jgi:hypothetical protein
LARLHCFLHLKPIPKLSFTRGASLLSLRLGHLMRVHSRGGV